MAKIIGENELKKFVAENEIIQNGDTKCAEGIKYDFRLGYKFLKAGFNHSTTYFVNDYDPVDPIAINQRLNELQKSQDRLESTNKSLEKKIDDVVDRISKIDGDLKEIRGSTRTLKWVVPVGLTIIALLITIYQLIFR
ncbi:MAG: hypothetical protein FWC20_04715 [Oscillospiraceae bacterium]|nr:hypothetical protein [Oscillospiraceae bacterium]MCL2278696.1 hypothetical protein [Oscillospiraceae bacterium]